MLGVVAVVAGMLADGVAPFNVGLSQACVRLSVLQPATSGEFSVGSIQVGGRPRCSVR
jgi:hypothetical protein